MSIYNNLFLHTGPDGIRLTPEILLMSGPVLSVEVSIPSTLAAALTKEDKALPNPTTGWALIDTGATRSCVDDDVIRKLGVNINAQKVNNQPIIALIGRDILKNCIFIYNGPLGMYTLSI